MDGRVCEVSDEEEDDNNDDDDGDNDNDDHHDHDEVLHTIWSTIQELVVGLCAGAFFLVCRT